MLPKFIFAFDYEDYLHYCKTQNISLNTSAFVTHKYTFEILPPKTVVYATQKATTRIDFSKIVAILERNDCQIVVEQANSQ